MFSNSLTGAISIGEEDSSDGYSETDGYYETDGRQNHKGEMLIDFCLENQLFITNIMVRHRERRKVTWRSPDGRTANMIDYILVGKSDLRLRIRKPQQPMKSLQRYRVDLLKNIETRNRYRTALSNNLSRIQPIEAPTVEEIDRLVYESTSIIRETASEILGIQTHSDKPWITPKIIDLCVQKCTHANKVDR
ncbi:hypothetical protein QYM36_010013 [Artemia franciscana]|uniref:Uncharacterized protein n=1 Tax=Artemia franciscana TaxID=6661 RepID=A0AA88LBE4_ARTSF|nr:hypothetical protein QYM36_010013 [Artemia franciscana]